MQPLHHTRTTITTRSRWPQSVAYCLFWFGQVDRGFFCTDSNDINVPAVTYASDKTLITSVNGTHLLTRIYYRTVDESSVGCISNLIPGVVPPPDMFSTATYLGRMSWDNQMCDAWQMSGAAGVGMVYYVSVATGGFVGFRTSDGSQIVSFLYFAGTKRPVISMCADASV